MGELVTQSEAARRFGVTRQSVHDLVTRGVLPLTNGKVDLEVASDLLKRRLDPGRSKILQLVPPAATPAPEAAAPGDDAPVTSFQVARTLREKYNALEARLRYEQACGRLVDAERVGLLITNATSSVRLALDVLPDKLAARLAAESDEVIVHGMLVAAIDEALAELLDLDLAAAAAQDEQTG